MQRPTNRFDRGRPLEVTLDSVPVVIPHSQQASLNSIRSYLERLAVARERSLFVIFVDGLPLLGSGNGSDGKLFHVVHGTTICLGGDLTGEMVRIAKTQALALQGRLQEVQLLMLINDWSVIRRLWRELDLHLRTPMLALGYLRDLGSTPNGPCKAMTQPLTEHWQELSRIETEVERHLLCGDVFRMSETMDKRLSAWLEKLGVLLSGMAEEQKTV